MRVKNWYSKKKERPPECRYRTFISVFELHKFFSSDLTKPRASRTQTIRLRPGSQKRLVAALVTNPSFEYRSHAETPGALDRIVWIDTEITDVAEGGGTRLDSIYKRVQMNYDHIPIARPI